MEYGAPRMEGKERPFIVGLLLTIVTLGIYPFYWHWKVHDELSRQMGRENRAAKIWIAYVVIGVVSFVIAVMIVVAMVGTIIDRAAEDPDYEPTPDEIATIIGGAVGLVVLAVVVGIVSLVLFIIYTIKMHELLREAAARQGRTLRGGGAGAFFGLYFGGVAAGAFIPLIGLIAELIMVPWAYAFLQGNYNDVWSAIKQGRALPTDAEMAGRPTAAPGGPPPALSYGAPSGTSYTGPPAGPTSWEAGGGASRGASSSGGSFARHRSAGQASIRQSFECPRCRAHMEATGPPGAQVDIRCSQCGEAGRVTLPAA